MITSNLSKEQKMEALTKDFLERDGNTFVRIRRTGRLGWENTIPQDGAYSDFITGSQTPEELIKKAYTLACNMITVMDSKDKVQVRITPEESSTDSKTVWVATKVFDDPDMTIGKKLDTFLGLAIHEGCHLLYTDFPTLGEVSNRIVGFLQNMIEDERIERECGEQKPGLANFLAASKYYMFDKYHNQMVREGRMEGLSTFKRLMNVILGYIRYPKVLKADELEEFSDPLLQVKEILSPYPGSTRESLSAAEKIYEVIKQYEEQQQQERKSSREANNKGESTESGKTVETGNPANSGDENTVENNLEKEFDSMSDALQQITQQPKSGLSDDDQSETVKKDGGRAGKVCEGRMENGIIKGSYIEKAGENEDVYKESLSRVKQFIPAVSKALQCESMEHKFIVRGMRSGHLDTLKIAEAYQGVPTVYTRQGEVKSSHISVCILIDESGSMWGAGEMAARDTAILLNEALGRVGNIDLYIYGHTASRSTTNLFVYREGNRFNKFALGSTESRAGNHDSVAIREVAARVRKYTGDKVLFFMISDGAPNESTDMVRKAVDDIEKKGFDLVAISIDPYYDPSTMYRHNVNLSELSTLAIDLGKMVKKAVKDNTTKTIKY